MYFFFFADDFPASENDPSSLSRLSPPPNDDVQGHTLSCPNVQLADRSSAAEDDPSRDLPAAEALALFRRRVLPWKEVSDDFISTVDATSQAVSELISTLPHAQETSILPNTMHVLKEVGSLLLTQRQVMIDFKTNLDAFMRSTLVFEHGWRNAKTRELILKSLLIFSSFIQSYPSSLPNKLTLFNFNRFVGN